MATFIIAIENWNGELELIHVKPLQLRNEGEYGSLIFTVRSIADAEEARLHGIVMASAIHPAEIYNRECRTPQCFNCQGYGHFSTRCTNKTKCGRCAHDHNTSFSQAIDISSHEASDDGFNDLDGSSDEEFRASKNGDKITGDD